MAENFSQSSSIFSKGRHLPSGQTTSPSFTPSRKSLILALPGNNGTCQPSPNTIAPYSMFLVRRILSPMPSPETPYHRSVWASTKPTSPTCNPRSQRCPPVGHLSPPFSGKTSPLTIATPPSSATLVQAALALGYLFLSDDEFSTSSTDSPIPPPTPQLPSSSISSYGMASQRTPRLGLIHILLARPSKSTSTSNQGSAPFHSLSAV